MLRKRPVVTGPTECPAPNECVPDAAQQSSGSVLIGLREAQQTLPVGSLAALRWARANDEGFPASADKRGTELLYRVTDLEKWARNRPRSTTRDAELG
ncbi:hypothetical protein [Streptomyces sp. NPDC056144]|uniref:hypothetical protein n=1 Tax=unclassified Streptomyces TaxID=2593676 RepID=UPI0035D6560E